MIRSPYDGERRTLLRLALAAVAAADLVVLGVLVATTQPSALSHPLAPRWLLALGGRPQLSIPIAAVGLFALWRFARRERSPGAALVAVGALALLCEAHAALIEGPMRIFFTSGAMLTGWALGLSFARVLERTDGGAPDAERLAELGSVSALAATYVGAVTSKLLAGGISWADANTLRALVFTQRRLYGHSPFDFYARMVAEHAWVPLALALLTMVVQASALSYPFGPRLRMLSGSLLLGFHLNVWFLTPILFPQAMTLLAVFSYPWPRWIRRLRRSQPAASAELQSARAPGAVVRASLLTALPLVLLAVLFALPAVRAYAALQHNRPQRHPDQPPVAAPSVDVRALLDDLAIGDSVGPLEVVAIAGPVDRAIAIELAGRDVQFRISVVARGTRPMRAPASTDLYDLYYERVRPNPKALSPELRQRALSEISNRIARVEHDVRQPDGT